MTSYRYEGLSLLLLVLLPTVGVTQQSSATEVTDLVFSLDGRLVYSSRLDGRVQVWDVTTGKEEGTLSVGSQGVYDLDLSPDGKWLALACKEKVIHLWNIGQGKVQQTLKGHNAEVSSVAFSPDGKNLASGSYDGSVRLWDLTTSKEMKNLKLEAPRVTAVAFTPGGKNLLTTGTAVIPVAGLRVISSDFLRIWNLASGKEIKKLSATGTKISLAKDGQTVIVGGYASLLGDGAGGVGGVARINNISIRPTNQISLWNLARSRKINLIQGQGNAIALGKHGRYHATGRGSEIHIYGSPGVCIFGLNENTRSIHLYETASGKEVWQKPWSENGAAVLAISSDSAKLAAGGKDGAVVIMDLTPPNWHKAEVKKFTDQDLGQFWKDLADGDARKAYRAQWILKSAGDRSVAVLKSKLKPTTTKADPGQIENLIKNLDSKRFTSRERASFTLRKYGPLAESALRRALKGNLTLEARQRVERLLEILDQQTLTPEQLQQVRALTVLISIETASSRALLEELALGEENAFLTEEARKSLRK